jgi:hypothetical protein
VFITWGLLAQAEGALEARIEAYLAILVRVLGESR